MPPRGSASATRVRVGGGDHEPHQGGNAGKEEEGREEGKEVGKCLTVPPAQASGAFVTGGAGAGCDAQKRGRERGC